MTICNRRQAATDKSAGVSPAPDRRSFLRTTLGAVGYWALAGCGGGGGATSGTTPGATLQARINAAQLFSVSAQAIGNIRARPESFLDLYGALATSTSTANEVVRLKLGQPFASLSDAGSMAAFATLIAFDCAPVGTTPVAPIPATMQQLLSSSALACGHFCKLTTMLSLLGHPELIPPDADAASPPKASVHFLVWLDSVPLDTGFHSQLVISNVLNDAYLLLDPTYGYVLRIPFVGAGPQPGLTVIENAATMLQTPIAQQNLAVLDPNGTADKPQMFQTLLSGALGPQFIEHDSIYGSEGWDTRIAQIFATLA